MHRPAIWGRRGDVPTRKMLNMRHTIALVDDDKNILTSVSMALEAEGFNVRSYSEIGRAHV